jgi:hypothetical protein
MKHTPGQKGGASKLWPQVRHWHWGTSVTNQTGLKPIGTVCNCRNRLPLRLTSALLHREHTSNSCRATSTKRMQPAP